MLIEVSTDNWAVKSRIENVKHPRDIARGLEPENNIGRESVHNNSVRVNDNR